MVGEGHVVPRQPPQPVPDRGGGRGGVGGAVPVLAVSVAAAADLCLVS